MHIRIIKTDTQNGAVSFVPYNISVLHIYTYTSGWVMFWSLIHGTSCENPMDFRRQNHKAYFTRRWVICSTIRREQISPHYWQELRDKQKKKTNGSAIWVYWQSNWTKCWPKASVIILQMQHSKFCRICRAVLWPERNLGKSDNQKSEI